MALGTVRIMIIQIEVETTVIIVREPSMKIAVFFAKHRPERDRHRIYRVVQKKVYDVI